MMDGADVPRGQISDAVEVCAHVTVGSHGELGQGNGHHAQAPNAAR